MAQILKGRLVKGAYKPICRDCAIYFAITVLVTVIVIFCLFAWQFFHGFGSRGMKISIFHH